MVRLGIAAQKKLYFYFYLPLNVHQSTRINGMVCPINSIKNCSGIFYGFGIISGSLIITSLNLLNLAF